MSTRYKRISLGDIHVEPQAQRALRPSWVQYLADNWDPEKVGVIQVGENGTGTYYVMDGQHRIAAMRERGAEDNATVRCLVYEDTDRKQRADLFEGFNTTRSVRAYDRFKVRVTAGDPTAIEIKNIVESFGLRILDQKSDGTVLAVNQLERVYTGKVLKLDDGPYPDVLKTTLSVIHTAWGDDAQAYNGPIIEGIGAFLLRYGNDVDPMRLAEKLAKRGSPIGFMGNAKEMAAIQRGAIRNGVASVLVDTYNHMLRSNALPPWDRI